ncbi:MAG: nuclease [Actinomycetaceae bacterium]|nr:nuclease [Actinomycetaceae bacterium]MDO5747001.1 nuclease [Actinomycetaceae bacterium]
MSVLGHRPEPDERPRWDRILEFADNQWTENTRPLFFLNASSGHMPMGFIQALMAMEYTPIPLSSEAEEDKVVDIGVQRTLQAIIDQGYGNVLLGSHDGDFLPLIRELLDQGRHVGIFCFVEFLSSQIAELVDDGLELYDLEHDIHAFQVALPRLHIIPLHEFNPVDYLS